MRILVVSDGWPPFLEGGAESVAAGLAEAYRRCGHEVAILHTVRGPVGQTRRTEDPIGSGCYRYAIPIIYPKLLRPYLSLCNPLIAGQIRAVLAAFAPDCAHVHNVHRYLGYQTLRLLHRHGVPFVATLHDAMSVDYGRFVQGYKHRPAQVDEPIDHRVHALPSIAKYHVQYFPLRDPLIRYHFRRYADRLCPVSRALAKLLNANGIATDEVINNGIDCAPFDAVPDRPDSLQQRLGLSAPRLVTVFGRLTPDKGAMQALDAIAAVRALGVDVALVLAGGSPGQFCAFDQAVAARGLEGAVAYAGWLSGADLIGAYRDSDVVLVPSVCLDAFPGVVLEAMACARPVVATCFGGAKEAVVDGETGFIVSPYNTTDMVDRIMTLVRDPSRGSRLGQAGRKRVESEFSVIGSAGRYLAQLEELVVGKRSVERAPGACR